MAKILSGVKSNRAEWSELRRSSVGASEVPTVCQINPYQKPIELWIDKVNEPYERETNEAQHWGNRLEPTVAQEVVEVLRKDGHTVDLIDLDALYRHDKVPHLTATPDFGITVNGEFGLVECKVTNQRNLAVWEEGPPDTAHVQALTQLEVIPEAKFCIVAGLILVPTFRMHRVSRSVEVQQAIVSKVNEFWRYVETKEPPPLTDYDAEILKRLYPQSDGSEILLPGEAQELIENYEFYRAERLKAEKAEEEFASKLKALLGKAERGVVGDYTVAWKDILTNRFDTKAFQAAENDIYRRYVRSTPSRRFTVTNTKRQDGEGQ